MLDYWWKKLFMFECLVTARRRFISSHEWYLPFSVRLDHFDQEWCILDWLSYRLSYYRHGLEKPSDQTCCSRRQASNYTVDQIHHTNCQRYISLVGEDRRSSSFDRFLLCFHCNLGHIYPSDHCTTFRMIDWMKTTCSHLLRTREESWHSYSQTISDFSAKETYRLIWCFVAGWNCLASDYIRGRKWLETSKMSHRAKERETNMTFSLRFTRKKKNAITFSFEVLCDLDGIETSHSLRSCSIWTDEYRHHSRWSLFDSLQVTLKRTEKRLYSSLEAEKNNRERTIRSFHLFRLTTIIRFGRWPVRNESRREMTSDQDDRDGCYMDQ